jgi:molybdopterin-guanine dinucleotide biosynthesis protein A/molybdopterin converting factor small subunit
MGRPKALVKFDGEPLIAHLVRLLKGMFNKIIIVAAPEHELPELPAVVVRDEQPFQGPVGGIYYGLRAAGEVSCFVTSCDAPFLSLSLIRFLSAQISHYDVVVPYWQERFQPLHAVYRASVAPFLSEQLANGELRPVTLFQKVRTLKVNEDEIRRLDPEGLSFLNMNTPADYEAALEIWKNRGRISLSPCLPVLRSVVTVELFGVARLLAGAREVALDLPESKSLSDVYSALGERFPVLVGRVIAADGRSLTRGYACNLNGVDFVRNTDARVNSGDRIFIISADAGG